MEILTATVCRRVAPSGNGSRAAADCVVPDPSVARTRSRYCPGAASHSMDDCLHVSIGALSPTDGEPIDGMAHDLGRLRIGRPPDRAGRRDICLDQRKVEQIVVGQLERIIDEPGHPKASDVRVDVGHDEGLVDAVEAVVWREVRRQAGLGRSVAGCGALSSAIASGRLLHSVRDQRRSSREVSADDS